MARITRFFKTQGEARAFADGIEYVNDSSVSVSDVSETDTPGQYQWKVVLDDSDKESDE